MTNQFIFFSKAKAEQTPNGVKYIPDTANDLPIPTTIAEGIRTACFFFKEGGIFGQLDNGIEITTDDGYLIAVLYAKDTYETSGAWEEVQSGHVHITLPTKTTATPCLSDYLAEGDCFRIRVSWGGSETYYSNHLRYTKNADKYFTSVKYRCKENAFDIPFAEGWSGACYCECALPIYVQPHAYAQEDKVYTKTDGDQVVLFSKITKTYQCETDYLPSAFHDRLTIALACDELVIDGKRVTKTYPYEVTWDEPDRLTDGTRLTQGTFKVTENTNIRNKNF